jgi:hypothetical protein
MGGFYISTDYPLISVVSTTDNAKLNDYTIALKRESFWGKHYIGNTGAKILMKLSVNQR